MNVRIGVEIDWVINVYKLISEESVDYVLDELRQVNAFIRALNAGGSRILTKAILETCYLNNSQITELCRIAVAEGTDFVKTSTGYGVKGASAGVVKLMKDAVAGGDCRVKASGGIQTLATALAMIEAGASRLGTSHSKTILEEAKNADLRPYNLSSYKIVGMLDHSVLNPLTTAAEVRKEVEFAIANNLKCVVVRPLHAEQCARLLKGTAVKTCFVVGFSRLASKDDGSLGLERYNIPLEEKLDEIRECVSKIRKI